MNNKPKENELDVNDLLGLPSIEELVGGTRNDKTETASDSPANITGNTAKESSQAGQLFSATPPIRENKLKTTTADRQKTKNTMEISSWENFMQHARTFNKKTRDIGVTAYRIDKDIAQALSSVDVYGLGVTQLLDCILRTFIGQHSGELRKMRRKRGRSMLDSD
ncbi:hypothetical protein IX307_001622 [Bacteroides pyogenes]|uniref:hypothetical protein n=1 Tax=Bacteroides pyogenes TaxID=310300 RepID=UPI001BAD8A0D|nr:hypothetical protein [Bacteroides pyogenes]MBR8724748.1 hypothetical protein [Bacteroides pyogenes]MBR8738164.1 hypothetical protein [Bacteroides pyogenes]MBR8753835.1 hypothetical protein [Bacteroides pyogenes]MBR8787297.1 hypothetical protein [Bacteroides pyogenes]MBR8792839.1 hypothetical protein [Bacteroides pyogenes]